MDGELSCPSTSRASGDSGFDSPGGMSGSFGEERLCVVPEVDVRLMEDARVLATTLDAAPPLPDYWPLQPDLKPNYRFVLVEWMREVCSELRSDVEVFPVAVSLLDRFLAVQPVFGHQLQSAGTACLFIASKVKEPIPVKGPKLVEFTDDSVKFTELLSWELLVLTKLGWATSGPTGLDLVQLLLRRLPLPAPLLARIRPLAIHVLHTLLLDAEFGRAGGGVQAGAAIACAGVRAIDDIEALPHLLEALADLLPLSQDLLEKWVMHSEAFLAQHLETGSTAHSATEEPQLRTHSPSLVYQHQPHPLQGPPLYYAA